MKKIALILSFVLLGSCTTKMGYNFMDLGLRWYVKSYVSLNKHQKDRVWEKIDQFHDWHRNTQLSHYADYIDKTKRYINNNEITGKWVHAQTDELQLMLDESLGYLLPTITSSLSDMDDQQTQQLLSNIAKDIEEYKEKSIFDEEKKTYKKRQKELRKSLSHLLGKLNDEQTQWLEEWSRELIPFEELSYAQQRNWLKQFETALQQRHSDPNFAATVKSLLVVDSDQWDPELDKIMDKNQEITYELIARIFNNLDERQKNKMDDKLSGYIKDFRELAGIH